MDERIDYDEYMNSKQWRRIRKWVLTFWGNKCALCTSSIRMSVHHRTYERLGKELLTDLIALCGRCHNVHHKELGHGGLEPIQDVLIRVLTKN